MMTILMIAMASNGISEIDDYEDDNKKDDGDISDRTAMVLAKLMTI